MPNLKYVMLLNNTFDWAYEPIMSLLLFILPTQLICFLKKAFCKTVAKGQTHLMKGKNYCKAGLKIRSVANIAKQLDTSQSNWRPSEYSKTALLLRAIFIQ